MKTFFKTLILSTIIALSLISCKKDDTKPGGGNIDNVISGNNCRLLRVHQSHANHPQLENIDEYAYYSDNRLGRILYTSNGQPFDSIRFEYNQKDLLAFVTKRTSSWTPIYDTLEKYHYDYQNRLIRIERFDSHQDSLVSQFKFSYTGLETPSELHITYRNYLSEHYRFKWTNGNLTKVNILMENGQTLNYPRTLHITYDSKNNPFKGLFHSSLSIFDSFSKNNSVKLELDSSGHRKTWWNYQYVYQGNYPVKKVEGDYISELEYLCN